MAYNYEGAISAGAKPSDVIDYLSKQTGYNSQGALQAGANPQDVLKYMSNLPTKTQSKPVAQPNKSFQGLGGNSGFNVEGSTKSIADSNTPNVLNDLGNVVKGLASGTVESGKDIAAGIGGNTMATSNETQNKKLSDSDLSNIKTIVDLKNKAQAEGKDTTHYDNLLKNYKLTDGQNLSEVFPQINKSPEQVLGDFGSMALEATGSGELAAGGAKKIATDEGLPLMQRVINHAVTGGKYGAGFGITGAMQNNESGENIGRAAATGGATGLVLGGLTGGLFGKGPAGDIASQESGKLDSAVGKVIQGSEADIPKAKEALSGIDLKDIKTYKDLGKALNDKVKQLSGDLDTKLEAKKDVVPMDKLTFTTKVGDQDISHNYVQDAMDQLKQFYSKTNDQVGITEIEQLEKKAKGLTPEETNDLKVKNLTNPNYKPPEAGLTVKEVNDLAKLHGAELSGFNANGELASGLSKQAAENTRTGVKATGRSLFGDKAYEDIDDKLTKTINTRELVGDMADKVNQLKQKVTERGWGEKIGRLVFQVSDKLTGGGLKGFVQSFVPRGEGLKIENALDLQKGLKKNLNLINDALNSGTAEEAESKLKSILKAGLKDVNFKDTPNKNGGFVKIGGKGFSEIPDGTKSEMVKAIDYLRSGKEVKNVEDTVSKLARKYNINEDWSNAKIANAFEDLIDKTKTGN